MAAGPAAEEGAAAEHSGRASGAADGGAPESPSAASSLSLAAGAPGANGAADPEVARFGAAKERKHSLESGLALFNRCHCCGDNPRTPLQLPDGTPCLSQSACKHASR